MMGEWTVCENAEPPKVYVDGLEKTRVIEFVTYTTKIVESDKNEKTD